jgi:hypothetical protein
MSWNYVRYEFDTGFEWQGGPYCDPDTLKCYGFEHVASGGNYKLYELDLSTLTLTRYDLGVPVESTDGHYNLSMCDFSSDRRYLICCRARWSSLRCAKVDLTTKTFTWMGEIAPGGRSDLNYPKWIKVRPDRYLMYARTHADGAAGRAWTFFEFKDVPENILDSTKWSVRQVIPYDVGDGVTACVSPDLNHMYNTVMFMDPYEPHKIWFSTFSRCPPSPNQFKLALYYYDMVRDEIYGWKGDKIDRAETPRSYDDRLAVDTTPPPEVTNAYRHDLGPAMAVGVRVGNLILLPISWVDTSGASVGEGIIHVDLVNKTSTRSGLSKVATDIREAKLWPLIPTADGKVIAFQGHCYNVGTLVVYDPATRSLTELIPGFRVRAVRGRAWLSSGHALIQIPTIISGGDTTVVWANWQTDTKILRKCVATGGAGSIKVDVDFWYSTPSRLDIEIYKLPDLTPELTDSITNPPKPLSKTYSVTAGKKRVLCRAVP